MHKYERDGINNPPGKVIRAVRSDQLSRAGDVYGIRAVYGQIKPQRAHYRHHAADCYQEYGSFNYTVKDLRACRSQQRP